MNKTKIAEQLLHDSGNLNACLSALEMVRTSGVDLNKGLLDSLFFKLRMDSWTGPCMARFLDLNLYLNQMVGNDGKTRMEEILSLIIDHIERGFFNDRDISLENHMLSQLEPDPGMNRLRALEELKGNLQESPCEVGLSNWIQKYVLYRKLRNWRLGRSFEMTAPIGNVKDKTFDEDKEVDFIDFFGVDADIEDPWGPFRATGVSIVFQDRTTLKVGASGPVIPVYNDYLEDEDVVGKKLQWWLPWNLPCKLINCRYSYYPLKSVNSDSEQICLVTRLHFCTYMLTIRVVKSFERSGKHDDLSFDKEVPMDSKYVLQCVLEPFNGVDYETFWDVRP